MAEYSNDEQSFADLMDLLNLMDMAEDGSSSNPLDGMDRHDVQDLADGCGRTGQAVPHEHRFWMRQGRFCDSRRFNAMFRCM